MLEVLVGVKPMIMTALGNYILSNMVNSKAAPKSNKRQRAMAAMSGSHATTSMLTHTSRISFKGTYRNHQYQSAIGNSHVM